MKNVNCEISQVITDLWKTDQANGNGLHPVLTTNSTHPCVPEQYRRHGYILIDTTTTHQPGTRTDKQLLMPFIPPQKQQDSYDVIESFLDNFDPYENINEAYNQNEKEEITNFIDMLLSSKPMKLARQWISSTNEKYHFVTDSEWIDEITEVWFGSLKGCTQSAFEHMFVGEQGRDSTEVGGYHFWYTYFLDDTGSLTGRDDLEYLHLENSSSEVATIRHRWNPFEEPSASQRRAEGSFFLGCSAECLMAIGMAGNHLMRMTNTTEATVQTKIGDGTYEITFTLDRHGHLRGFHPKVIKQ